MFERQQQQQQQRAARLYAVVHVAMVTMAVQGKRKPGITQMLRQ